MNNNNIHNIKATITAKKKKTYALTRTPNLILRPVRLKGPPRRLKSTIKITIKRQKKQIVTFHHRKRRKIKKKIK